ncbi:hypothetical protein LPJ64_002906 [Coemansia asiatica]|uniref:Adhesin domain-containing protein n=1 Tax=Coemansia asiatica TaxID=1052880 RepID=A0A9W7XM50_9FUNG|nr:hypothetical protein LPJ64_002906 [Coemansia asiatica]
MKPNDKDSFSQVAADPVNTWYQTSATESASALMPVPVSASASASSSATPIATATSSATFGQINTVNPFFRRSHPVELPPEYSIVDPNPGQQPQPAVQPEVSLFTAAVPSLSPSPSEPPGFHRQNSRNELAVGQKKPKELEAIQGFPFDRPLLIRTTNIQSSSLVIEHDSDPENIDSIIVSAIVTGQKSDIQEKCEITTLVNVHGEYDFHVNSNWSMWSLAKVKCSFFIRVPPSANLKHPGICIDLATSSIETRHINNIEFDRIDIKTECGMILLNGIRGGLIHAATSSSELRVMNINASVALELKTTNAKISLSDIQASRISAKTSNSPIALKSVVAQFANIETTNSKIECDTVSGNELHLQTNNSTITSSNMCANSLFMDTTNAKIEGTWEIQDLLDICTTNSKIEGYVLFKEPSVKTSVRLKTTNAKIKVRLPAEKFSGTFDLKTSSRAASVAYKEKEAQPVTYIVQDKSYKKGSVGDKDKVWHDISAKTSNSGIEILLI